MSFKTKLAAVALAAVAFTSTIALSSNEAKAGNSGVAIGLGIATGALIGAAATGGYAYGYHPSYVGYRSCHWVNQYDAYGYYVGRSRVCGYAY